MKKNRPPKSDAPDSLGAPSLLHFPEEAAPRTPVISFITPWQPLQLFNGYRLVLGLALILIPLYRRHDLPPFEWQLAISCSALFVLLITAGLLLSFFWKRHFYVQLTLQVFIDALGIGILASLYGGIRSGLSLALLISIAGASLVAQGKLARLYAAIATLSVLGSETFGMWDHTLSNNDITSAGFLSLGFFAIAISANLLGQRLTKNEALARQHGIERENQMRINQQVMEHMQDGVIVVNARGKILGSNLKARNMLDMEEQPRVLAEILPELAKGHATWREKKHPSAVILEISRPAGQAQAISARFVPTRTTNQAGLIFLEDLNRLREEVQQLKLASLGRLTASIAHEIRNPLASISHAAELLSEENADDTGSPLQYRLTRIILENIQRLDHIVQDVLTLGRQSIPERQEHILLAPYLEKFVLELMKQENLEEGVLQISVPDGACLDFEPMQLQQVLWNLVTNALRYSTRNEGAIRLEVRLDNGVELHVIDDGPGVSDDLREQIFEPFFTTSSYGSGLGLHIARELCAVNGVRLLLSSGGGGHFILQGESGHVSG
ncbi:MAG: histidine kinase [Zoogloeaceae bacterium]|jgi:two-component system sensor histidine kinase PilS (NtrC family)|nr:histidine kinase [Zoogloeaceae bacterium]